MRLRIATVITVLLVLSTGCGGGSSDPVEASPAAADVIDADGNGSVGSSISSGVASCLSDNLSYSEFALRFEEATAPAVSLEREADGVELVRDVFSLDARSSEFAFGTAASSERDVAELGLFEFASWGKVEIEAQLRQRAQSGSTMLLVGRTSTLGGGNQFTGVFDLSEGSVELLDTCTGSWVDVTDELEGVAAAVGVTTPLEALELVVSDSSGPIRALGSEALELDPDRNVQPWSERLPTERRYLDADLPVEVGESLIAVRVHLGVGERPDEQDSAEELANYAICPVQATARTGFCVSLSVFGSADGVVLEVPLLPEEALDFWLVDERDMFAADPVGVLVAVERPSDGSHSIILTGDPDGVAAAGFMIGAELEVAEAAWLDDPLAYDLVIAGGFDSSWVG